MFFKSGSIFKSQGSIFLIMMLTVSILNAGGTSCFAQPPTLKPRLILQITIDQLRGDFPFRYYDRLPDGGFKYLIDKGTVYMDAHHDHANTETIVGHATLATGAHPSTHGMIGNLWLDREKGRTVYNIEDDQFELLSKNAGVDKKTEIDHTQKAANTSGRSPAAILVSTFSDELASYTAGKSKVFGVSVKDRGAVSMAGRRVNPVPQRKEFQLGRRLPGTHPDQVARGDQARDGLQRYFFPRRYGANPSGCGRRAGCQGKTPQGPHGRWKDVQGAPGRLQYAPLFQG